MKAASAAPGWDRERGGTMQKSNVSFKAVQKNTKLSAFVEEPEPGEEEDEPST